MTTQKAAMEQALKALEQSETTVPYEGFGMMRRKAERDHQAAISALRAALAETAEPVGEVSLTAMQQAGKAAAHYHAWSKRYTTPPPEPVPAVERAKPDCSECAERRQRALDNQQWIRDVAKGREEIRRMAIEAHEAKKSKEDKC